MDTLSSITLWGYQETFEDLKHKLWTTICELEEVKNTAREEIRKKDENINQLIQLVKAANQERDEANDQLQILLNKLTQPNSVQLFPAAPFLQPESPQIRQGLGSSSITESENLTDAHNNQSHVSSPTVVDSFVDASISPDLSIVNFADSSNNAFVSQKHMMTVCSPPVQDDVMKVVFDRFAKKPLPEKGRLLKAVMDAGPILDTLFVAGSLPRWRNPPPLKPLLVPPISIRGDDALNTSNLLQNCNAGLQATTSSPKAYYGVGAVCQAKRPLMEHCAGSQQCLTGKKQKSQ